jgi:hypothetical protein
LTKFSAPEVDCRGDLQREFHLARQNAAELHRILDLAYRQMETKTLTFTEEDVRLVYRGLAARTARRASETSAEIGK